MGRGSQMIVITDAASKRPEIVDTVIRHANRQGVCIHFFISRMNSYDSLRDGIYQRVSQQTAGTLISNFANWQLARFISESSNTPCVNPNYTPSRPRPQKRSTFTQQETFEVSVLTYLLKLSMMADSGVNIFITRPDGSIATVLSQNNFAVFSEGQPLHGLWSVQVDSGIVQVSVAQQIALDIVIYYVSDNSSEIASIPPQACMLINLDKYKHACKYYVLLQVHLEK